MNKPNNLNGKRIYKGTKSDKEMVVDAMRTIELGHRNSTSYDYQSCDIRPCSWCLFIRNWFKERNITQSEVYMDKEKMKITRFTFGYSQPYEGHYVEIHYDPEIDPVRLMDTYHGNCWAATYSDDQWAGNIAEDSKCLLRVKATRYGHIEFEVLPDKEVKA